MKNPTVAIVGYGQLGRFMAKHLKPYCRVIPIERDTAPQNIYSANMVIFAVPWSGLETAVMTLKPYIQKEALILDVTSVKQKPLALLKKHFKGHEILGTHPIFGPESGKNGLNGLPIVVCNVSFTTTHYKQIKQFLSKNLKLKVIEQTAGAHDRDMALVQGLTHFIGRAVIRMGITRHVTDTKSYTHLCELKQLLENDSWELFKTIQNTNPAARKVRRSFLKELTGIENELSN